MEKKISLCSNAQDRMRRFACLQDCLLTLTCHLAKEVSNLINHPVVSLFGSRVRGTGLHMVVERVDGELFETTDRERKLRQCRYCCTNTRGEEILSEASRPGLISVMRPDLSQPTYGFIPEDPPRSVLFI